MPQQMYTTLVDGVKKKENEVFLFMDIKWTKKHIKQLMTTKTTTNAVSFCDDEFIYYPDF